MKDLGKTIAKYRKEHKLNQSQLAKELENYDIYVKQNSISAWELGTATPQLPVPERKPIPGCCFEREIGEC